MARRINLHPKRHGLGGSKSRPPEYGHWLAMRNRCRRPTFTGYELYGGRGVTVCARWMESFETFFADVGPRPGPQYSLDRINADGNYAPDNVRWATKLEQSHNRRTNVLLTYDGETLCAKEWSKRFGINHQTIRRRKRLGWSDVAILTTPTKKRARTEGMGAVCS